MDSPVPLRNPGEDGFDSSKPFLGIVVCCTSIAPEQRSDIAKMTAELGGVHKYDLTPDVTHLIVGAYDTPKYRHVAKERPDIRPMTVGWVDAVISLWRDDAEIDLEALEQEWRLLPLQTGSEAQAGIPGTAPARGGLLCCLTGLYDADERKAIIEKIEVNGGTYTGDLSKAVTHLIVFKPEGRKYTAAKSWNIHTVVVEWLHDSVARTMILDEKAYDPLLPPEERGKGAWVRKSVKRTSLGKRQRVARAANEEGAARKLRKTASMKLKTQRDNLWGDILSRQPSFNQPASKSEPGEPQQAETTERRTSFAAQSEANPEASTIPDGAPSDSAVFSSCCFYVHGFSTSRTQRTIDTLIQMGGKIVSSMEEMNSIDMQNAYTTRIVVVPQVSQPHTHPPLTDGLQIVTEFYIERCLFTKTFTQPGAYVLGQPFPVFPIQGLEEISICTSGFTGVDLHHIDRAICQLGASYQERFTPDISMLLCTSLSVMRRQKLQLALNWGVPVLDIKWLWECISTGYRAPMEAFLFPKLNQRGPFPWKRGKPDGTAMQCRPGSRSGNTQAGTKCESAAAQSRPMCRSASASAQMKTFRSAPVADPTPTADSLPPTEPSFVLAGESVDIIHFETAPTHQPSTSKDATSKESSRPLSEASASSLNKPAPPACAPSEEARKPLARVFSEVADSEAAGDSDYARESAEPESRREREKRAAAAAERAALASRLTSLLQGAAGDVNAEGNPSSNAVSMPMTTVSAEDKQTGRRQRSLIGRAVSNVSAASTGGHEPNKAAVRAGGNGPVDCSELPEQSTQLEYEDPAAKRHKAQLLNKLGRGAGSGERPGGSEEMTVARKTAHAPAAGIRKIRPGRSTKKGFC